MKSIASPLFVEAMRPSGPFIQKSYTVGKRLSGTPELFFEQWQNNAGTIFRQDFDFGLTHH
ncbi:hypothetical protein H0H81_007308, partial [Sphagnurus paluster]